VVKKEIPTLTPASTRCRALGIIEYNDMIEFIKNIAPAAKKEGKYCTYSVTLDPKKYSPINTLLIIAKDPMQAIKKKIVLPTRKSLLSSSVLFRPCSSAMNFPRADAIPISRRPAKLIRVLINK
jgi:hypothetical protein